MARDAVFDVRGLEVVLGGQRVLGPLDLDVRQGSFIGILGPNGSGKTTLLRALTGTVKPTAGTVLLEGRPLTRFRATELARRVGVVPQQFYLDFSFTVREMVSMGRYAHPRHEEQRGKGASARDEAEAVDSALAQTGLTDLADRLVTELSGGERQRALIAQTLAQQTPTLLLDEPLNNLDLNHQLEIMQLLAGLHAEGRTIAVVLHDLNMAAQYCEELLLLESRAAGRARRTERGARSPSHPGRLPRPRGRPPPGAETLRHTPVDQIPREICEEPLGGVHVIAGGGAASELIEELVLRGLTPSVGIVSVFDTDYSTAQRYELEVVSAPPFQPFPADALQQLQTHIREADMLAVAPIFFGPGNLEPLRMTLEARRSGKPVVIVDQPPITQRDLTGGDAERIMEELLAAGAIRVTTTAEVVAELSRLSA